MFHVILLTMKKVADRSCRESQNTHFMFNNFFQNLCLWWDNMEKYCWAGQSTVDNMVHAHCMLDT